MSLLHVSASVQGRVNQVRNGNTVGICNAAFRPRAVTKQIQGINRDFFLADWRFACTGALHPNENRYKQEAIDASHRSRCHAQRSTKSQSI
jgi:hypothetical protein